MLRTPPLSPSPKIFFPEGRGLRPLPLDPSPFSDTLCRVIVVVTAGNQLSLTGLVIRDASDAVLEQGPATLVGGRWTYTARAGVGSGESVTIEATATDRPGHTGARIVTWTNA